MLWFRNRDGNERFLSVDKNLGKCEERSGWLMVIDGDVEFACDWQVSAAYPLILFSRRTSGSNWNSGTNTGKASRLAVFVQYYMHGLCFTFVNIAGFFSFVLRGWGSEGY